MIIEDVELKSPREYICSVTLVPLVVLTTSRADFRMMLS